MKTITNKSANIAKIVCTLCILCFHQTSSKPNAIFHHNATSEIENDGKAPLKCTANPLTVTANLTKLQPGSKFHNLCRYEIPKQPGICQIRLDFVKFQIAEGDRTQYFGECNADTLSISGHTNAMMGNLCGNLGGQHMYLDYGWNSNIYIDLYMMVDLGQTWDVKVTMIQCDSEEKAPPGCLQYFTDPRGTVKSFNFNNRHQLNNQDYSVCVKTNAAMRKITWTACSDTDFAISGDPFVNGPGGGGMSGNDCTNDWVMFYGISKYCGTYLPASPAIETRTQPFMMNVHFDSLEILLPPSDPGTPIFCPPEGCDIQNSGFCLMYATTPN